MKEGRRQALLLGAAGITAAAAGFFAGPALLQLSGSADSKMLLAARFKDLEGKPRALAEWKDRILLCNFWATWCAPCREEIPLLVAARQKYAARGVEVVGIAIDNAAKVGQFAASFNIPYPVLVAEAEGLDLMRELGNKSGGLPYTVVVDRKGALVHRKLGALHQPEIDQMLGALV